MAGTGNGVQSQSQSRLLLGVECPPSPSLSVSGSFVSALDDLMSTPGLGDDAEYESWLAFGSDATSAKLDATDTGSVQRGGLGLELGVPSSSPPSPSSSASSGSSSGFSSVSSASSVSSMGSVHQLRAAVSKEHLRDAVGMKRLSTVAEGKASQLQIAISHEDAYAVPSSDDGTRTRCGSAPGSPASGARVRFHDACVLIPGAKKVKSKGFVSTLLARPSAPPLAPVPTRAPAPPRPCIRTSSLPPSPIDTRHANTSTTSLPGFPTSVNVSRMPSPLAPSPSPSPKKKRPGLVTRMARSSSFTGMFTSQPVMSPSNPRDTQPSREKPPSLRSFNSLPKEKTVPLETAPLRPCCATCVPSTDAAHAMEEVFSVGAWAVLSGGIMSLPPLELPSKVGEEVDDDQEDLFPLPKSARARCSVMLRKGAVPSLDIPISTDEDEEVVMIGDTLSPEPEEDDEDLFPLPKRKPSPEVAAFVPAAVLSHVATTLTPPSASLVPSIRVRPASSNHRRSVSESHVTSWTESAAPSWHSEEKEGGEKDALAALEGRRLSAPRAQKPAAAPLRIPTLHKASSASSLRSMSKTPLDRKTVAPWPEPEPAPISAPTSVKSSKTTKRKTWFGIQVGISV